MERGHAILVMTLPPGTFQHCVYPPASTLPFFLPPFCLWPADMTEQSLQLGKFPHIVIATPGRLATIMGRPRAASDGLDEAAVAAALANAGARKHPRDSRCNMNNAASAAVGGKKKVRQRSSDREDGDLIKLQEADKVASRAGAKKASRAANVKGAAARRRPADQTGGTGASAAGKDDLDCEVDEYDEDDDEGRHSDDGEEECAGGGGGTEQVSRAEEKESDGEPSPFALYFRNMQFLVGAWGGGGGGGGGEGVSHARRQEEEGMKGEGW